MGVVACVHLCAQGFRETNGFCRRSRLPYPIAYNYDGILGIRENFRCFLNRVGVGSDTRVCLVRRHNLNIRLVVQCVCRERNIHGAHRMGFRLNKGAAHYAWDLLRVGYFRAPLAELADHLNQIGAPFCQLADVLVCGGQDQRGVAFSGVGKQADTVRKAGLDVQVDEGGLATIARVGIGHAHRRALLHREHVANVRVVLQLVNDWPFAGTRISENVIHALSAEHFHERTLACHFWHVESPMSALP